MERSHVWDTSRVNLLRRCISARPKIPGCWDAPATAAPRGTELIFLAPLSFIGTVLVWGVELIHSCLFPRALACNHVWYIAFFVFFLSLSLLPWRKTTHQSGVSVNTESDALENQLMILLSQRHACRGNHRARTYSHPLCTHHSLCHLQSAPANKEGCLGAPIMTRRA